MQHIEKVNINQENKTVAFHTVNETRVYNLLSYKTYLQVQLSEFYQKSNQWDIDALIDTADAEKLLTGYNEKFTEDWNDSRLIGFEGTSEIKEIDTRINIKYPRLRGKELVNTDSKRKIPYALHEIVFENGLSGKLVTSDLTSFEVGQKLSFTITKKYGKYRKNYETKEYYYPIYYSIEIKPKKCKGCLKTERCVSLVN